jgi:putative transposase
LGVCQTHKLTTYLTKNHSEIVIEDLNVAGMSKNHKMASAILDGGFSEFRKQVEYKCKWYGSILTVVDRFYPSSKTCSCCESIKKTLKLSERVYRCDNCGTSIDRDLNAAINLKKKAESSPV